MFNQYEEGTEKRSECESSKVARASQVRSTKFVRGEVEAEAEAHPPSIVTMMHQSRLID